MKTVWTWVIATHPSTIAHQEGEFVWNDLFFSTKEKFFELLGRPLNDAEALVQVQVPDDFDDLDYIPENY